MHTQALISVSYCYYLAVVSQNIFEYLLHARCHISSRNTETIRNIALTSRSLMRRWASNQQLLSHIGTAVLGTGRVLGENRGSNIVQWQLTQTPFQRGPLG